MTAPWLSVVGIGEDGMPGLVPSARAVVEGAALLVGGRRHLAMIPDDGRPRLTWPKPLTDAFPELLKWKGKPVCVLASGDPMLFGVGVTLSRHFPIAEMSILPGQSAFSLAAARLGWGLMDCDLLTLHGRPAASLEPAIQPGARLLILSWDGTTPKEVARLLTARGFGESRISILEAIGGPSERRVEGTAQDWQHDDIADLNCIAVECVPGDKAKILPCVPGLPDEAFRHDGQLTKREVRATTLSHLMPIAGQRLWDIGAGCGSISIEWLRAAPRTKAIAIERNQSRLALIAENATALGVPSLEIIDGEAPSVLEGLPLPDAVFVGGGASNEGLLEAAWAALLPGGRLVANAVTLESEAKLKSCHDRWGGWMLRLQVSRLEPVGPYRGWRPLMPVTIYSVTKE